MREFAEHLLELAATPWGPVILVLHGYLESFILPVAHDLFLVAVCLAQPKLSFIFALMSTIASVLGISTGYLIGKWGGRKILEKILKPNRIDDAEKYIRKYDFWAVAIACFTPIPVKVFAVLAGTVGLNFKKLFVVAFFARGARFFLISTLLYFAGDAAKEWILSYLNIIMIAFLIGLIAMALIWHRIPLKKA